MKTVNVPQIGGLDDLVALVSDPRKFKPYLAELKGALQELRDAAGGVEALREAGSLRNKAKGAMTEAAAILAAAREKAEALSSQIAEEAEEVRSAKKALEKQVQDFEQDLAELRRGQANLRAAAGAWEKEKATQKVELADKAEELARRGRVLVHEEAAMRRRLGAATAALEGTA